MEPGTRLSFSPSSAVTTSRFGQGTRKLNSAMPPPTGLPDYRMQHTQSSGWDPLCDFSSTFVGNMYCNATGRARQIVQSSNAGYDPKKSLVPKQITSVRKIRVEEAIACGAPHELFGEHNPHDHVFAVHFEG